MKNRNTTQPREILRCLRNAVDRAQGRRGTSRALHRCIDPPFPPSLMVASLAWSLWWPVSVSCETDVPECRKPLWRILHLRRRRTESTSQIPRRKTSRNLCPESDGSPPVERGGDDVVQLFRLFRRWWMDATNFSRKVVGGGGAAKRKDVKLRRRRRKGGRDNDPAPRPRPDRRKLFTTLSIDGLDGKMEPSSEDSGASNLIALTADRRPVHVVGLRHLCQAATF